MRDAPSPPREPDPQTEAELQRGIQLMNERDRTKWEICPHASTVECYDRVTRDNRMLPRGCGRRRCQVCSRKIRNKLAKRIANSKPNRMLTLTCRHEHGPDYQFRHIAKQYPILIKELRKHHAPIEYVRIAEFCKDGYPHFHALLRSGFIPHDLLRHHWHRLTGAMVVHITLVHKPTVTYCCKYVSKALDAPSEWARKIVTASKGFWLDDQCTMDAIGHHTINQHPADYYNDDYRTEYTANRVNPGQYSLDQREPGDEWPTELNRPERDHTSQ